MDYPLRPVEMYHCTIAVGQDRKLSHRIDYSKHVGDMGCRDYFDLTLGQNPLRCLQVPLSVLPYRKISQTGARPGTKHLPWDDVGVVLSLREENLISGTDVLLPVDIGQQIDGGGGTGSKDYLIFRSGVDKSADSLSSGLVVLCSGGGQSVDCTVNIGIGVLEPAGSGLNDAAGFLCSRN